jgi:pilus assembly protein CpaB
MGRRTLLLIASILIAAVGTALIGLYVRGADDRAQQTEGMVTALVARTTIAAGTTIEDAIDLMEPAAVPARMAEGGYKNSGALTAVRAAQKGKVVQETINAQQVVLASMFGTAGEAATTDITQGLGVAVELTDPGRAAGLLAPGSFVRIYLIPEDTEPELKQRLVTNLRTGVTRLDPALKLPVILPKALVMRIGNSSNASTTTTRTSTGTQTDDVPRTIVTLDVDEAGADAVVSAQAFGELYFAVIGPES